MSSLATSGLDGEGSEQTATRAPLRLQCQQSLNMCPDVHVERGPYLTSAVPNHSEQKRSHYKFINTWDTFYTFTVYHKHLLVNPNISYSVNKMN